MEDLERSEKLLSEEHFNEQLKRRSNLESLKISWKDCCIICSRKVKSRKCDGDHHHHRKNEEQDQPEVVESEAKVDSSPAFVQSFNEIWTILKRKKVGNSFSCGEEDGVSLENLVTGKVGSKQAVFLEAPPFCSKCCDKVVEVENLIKAVRQQVREIQMLWENGRRVEPERVEDFTKEFQGQLNEERPETEDIEVKDEDEEDGMEMECDEDLPNSLVESDADSDVDAMDDDDDPDYIKSEQDDDDDEGELTSEEEQDEEPLTLAENYSVPFIQNDPLEISSSSAVKLPSENSSAPGGPRSLLGKQEICCDVKGCTLQFSSASTLYQHKKKCHSTRSSSSSIWEFGRASQKLDSFLSPKQFSCLLEGCTRSFPSADALYRHKMSCHTKLMIELGKLDPEYKHICSCGRRFPTHRKLYSHQSRNKTTHPDFEFKLRETRSLMIGRQICDFCGEPIKLSDILEHLAGHLDGGHEYVVKCPNFKECGHAFTHSKDLLDKHLVPKRFMNCRKICEKINLGLKCETCGFTTDFRIKLAAHVDNEHERGTLPKNLKCPIRGCKKMFAVKQSIFLHLHVHRYRPITTQNCDKCGEVIKVNEMEGHLKDRHGSLEIFGCKQCPLKFGERDPWVEHLWEHRDSGLSCDICGEDKPVKYLKYTDFRDHYWGVHKLCPKRYKCGQCENKVFWMKKELDKHKWLCRREAEDGPSSSSTLSRDKSSTKRTYNCGICDISFVSNVNLISHKIKVHGEDPFSCDICGQTFNYKTKFIRHQKEHAGMEFQKEWKCEVEGCGKVFRSKHNWKCHVKSGHGGDKPFVCEECGKGYAKAEGLKYHRDTVHLGLRPWVCDECGEAFANSSTLKRHKMIHSGERPFECEICGQRFRQKEVLGRHLKSHEKKGEDFKPNGPMKQIRKRKGQ